ncbi:hydrolase [Marinospirillum alkaliphilum]|uniref:Nicotinamidase-related amidase n=1 Tax=Marinospirillum alkaliphilum DSM 21637 TaxID=1122209 RepID=A0A1K1VV45_9GAMM|nr:hydrolase [Marinospirillum alkaliphilum]SFX28978.1 Nicotinamidase-related amidase [Marinospirillum alkaliphilum DSM 21637]
MLLQASTSLLLVVDIQSKLAPHIHQASNVINTSCWLLEIARELGVTIRATEQYPEGIGSSVSAIARLLKEGETLQKMHFSAMKEEHIHNHLADLGKPQVVLMGTEAHVCCFQTAADLLEQGYSVYLVEEGLGSRNPKDKQLALERLKQLGAQVVSREMVAFEWLEKAGTDTFRRINRGWIR